ncbi:MAG: histidine triad nucleotide-binding protein [Nitrospirales bacterium]|nr:histidine triad nucleotide-binding protein [Nitrospira sp.]MDR4500279.1 histidine triad nucleotide-binding protein [Nitrospirales bacterium]
MNDCIFCKIVDGSISSAKLYEDDDCLAFEDLNPQAPVHALVIPKKHLVALSDAEETDQALLGKLMLACVRVAKDKGLETNGYRVVTNIGREAGQTVFHLHVHVLGGRRFQWPPG